MHFVYIVAYRSVNRFLFLVDYDKNVRKLFMQAITVISIILVFDFERYSHAFHKHANDQRVIFFSESRPFEPLHCNLEVPAIKMVGKLTNEQGKIF